MFSVYPVWYLAALLVLIIAYGAFVAARHRQTGERQHARYRSTFVSLIVGFSVLYWGALGLFTGVRREHIFRARYEAFAVGGDSRHIAYRLHYIDYPDCSETVYLDELERYLETRKPSEVRLTLQTTWDFGTMSSYSLEKVDDIRVNAGWSNGHPPWSVLRMR